MQEQTLQLEQQSKLKVSSGGGAGRGRLHPCGGGTWKEKVHVGGGQRAGSSNISFLGIAFLFVVKRETGRGQRQAGFVA